MDKLSIAPGVRAALLAAAFVVAAACSLPRRDNGAAVTPVDVDRFTPAAATAATTGTAAPTVAVVVAGRVTILDFVFTPPAIRVVRGGTVTWMNDGSVDHRIVADSGAFDLGQVAPGKLVQLAAEQSGAFPYHCAIHPAMRGTLIVQ